MDAFEHMASVLTTVRSDLVESVLPLTKKKTRSPSDTKKYVLSRVHVYGTQISSLSYCVMERLLEGKTPEQIADELDLNINSVHQHKGTVSRKLGIERSDLMTYLRAWKEKNPKACAVKPTVEAAGAYQVDGVTLTKFKYDLLKELLIKDVDTVARERKVARSVVVTGRYELNRAFGTSWDKLVPRVRKFWKDNPPI